MNSELLEEIEKGDSNVGSAFLKYGPFFKVYSSYAKNFQKSVNVLEVRHTISKKIFVLHLRCFRACLFSHVILRTPD